MKEGLELAQECGQKYSIHKYDQQLWAFVQLIKFDIHQEMEHLINHLGSVYAESTKITCIGNIWSTAGLRDMLAHSGVYAELRNFATGNLHWLDNGKCRNSWLFIIIIIL